MGDVNVNDVIQIKVISYFIFLMVVIFYRGKMIVKYLLKVEVVRVIIEYVMEVFCEKLSILQDICLKGLLVGYECFWCNMFIVVGIMLKIVIKRLLIWILYR